MLSRWLCGWIFQPSRRMFNLNRIGRRAWLYLFLVLAAIYAADYSLHQVGKLEKSLGFYPIFVVAVIGAQLLFWIVYSVLWARLIAQMSNAELTVWESFRQHNLLTLGKYLPGKIWGMVARGASLAEKGLTIGEVVVLTCTEQTLVLHSAIVVSALLFVGLHPSLLSWSLAIVAVLTLGFGSQLLKIAYRVYRHVSSSNPAVSVTEKARPLSATTYLSFALGHSAGWIVNGFLFASIYCTFFSAASPSFQLLGVLLLANTVGVTLGFLAVFAPGGIGVREAMTSAMLATAMPLDEAVMLAVLFRLWLLLTDIFVGGFVVLSGTTRLR